MSEPNRSSREQAQVYRVRAVRWERGWELYIDATRATQSRTLTDAERVVADYLALDGEPDARFEVLPELDEATRCELDSVRRDIDSADQAQQQARARYRGFITALRGKGMTSTDIARVLKISRGRVSQLGRG